MKYQKDYEVIITKCPDYIAWFFGMLGSCVHSNNCKHSQSEYGDGCNGKIIDHKTIREDKK